jgi:protein phosphatase
MATNQNTENAGDWNLSAGLTPDAKAPAPTTACRAVSAAGVTDRGCHRPNNEDCYRIDGRLRLYLVADGMGGHVGGEVASQLAADTVVDALHELAMTADGRPDGLTGLDGFDETISDTGNRLRMAVHTAHKKLIEAGRLDASLTGMGTTMVAAQVLDGRLTVASVGDSRLYLFNGRTLRQVTRDDSWIEAMLEENPDADLAALHMHPLRHALTNVLSTVNCAEIHIVEEVLAGDEVIVLTTDGVHGTLDSSQMAHLLATRAEPAEAAAELVAAAIGHGSTDNCTAVVAACVV